MLGYIVRRTIAALLVAESCNIGWTPVIKHGVAALTRDRLAHVDATYLRMDTLSAANAALIEEQARIDLAQIWGGGHVASVDGCGSSCRCRPSTPATTRTTGARNGVRPG